MPDDAPNVAVAPAGDAPAAPAAPEKPYTPPEPKVAFTPERTAFILRRLAEDTNADGTVTEKPAPPPAPPREEKKVELAAKAESSAPTEPEKPIGVRRAKITRPALPVAEAAKPITPVEPAKPDLKWEEALEENEREMLADAREAAQLAPGRYKDLPGNVESFLRKHSEMVGRDDFDDQSPAYKAFVEANLPKLSSKDVREIQDLRVTRRVESEQSKKFDDMKFDFYRRTKEPEIEQQGQRLYTELVNNSLPADVAEVVKKDGGEKALKSMKLELDVVGAICAAATDDIKEMIRLSEVDPETRRPLAKEAMDPKDPKFQQHERLRAIMDDIDNRFKTTAPADKQFVNGKWFVTREELSRLLPNVRNQYWWFDNKQLIDQMKQHVKTAVATGVEQKRKEMAGYGFERRVAVQAPPAAPTPPPSGPSAPRAAPIPGPADNGVKSDIDARAARMAAHFARDN